MDTGITQGSPQHHISGPGLGIFKFQQILSIIDQADSIVVVFYNNLAVGHPSVKYFPRVFELASHVACEILSDRLGSDHHPIIITANASDHPVPERVPKWNFKKA